MHIGVIMDGNGRWAKKRNLPRTSGHVAGEEALMRWVRKGVEMGVDEMSFYTFSTENWNRSPNEVKFLMQISKRIMRTRVDEFIKLGVRVRWVGKKARLWKSVLNELEIIQQKTEKCQKMVVNFCINYGGRSEIVDAANSAINDAKLRKIKRVTEKSFAKYLYSKTMPDVDLLVRTSGEVRASNFLLWQIAYAEMIFIDDLWPDTNGATLEKCYHEYLLRNRRFGKV